MGLAKLTTKLRREGLMPIPYKCAKGGRHSWQTKKTPQGMTYKVCTKCGVSRPT